MLYMKTNTQTHQVGELEEADSLHFKRIWFSFMKRFTKSPFTLHTLLSEF